MSSSEHRAGRRRYAETTPIRYGQSVCVSSGPAGAAVSPTDKIDIVNVDFVAEAIATLHQKDRPPIRYVSSVIRHRIADVS